MTGRLWTSPKQLYNSFVKSQKNSIVWPKL